MSKKSVFIAAAFIAALLFLATLPAHAECDSGSDPDDPDCRLSPFQSQQVNPGAVSGDGSTGEVSSGGAGSSGSANDMPLISSDSLESSNSSSSGAGEAGDQKSGTKGEGTKEGETKGEGPKAGEDKGQGPKDAEDKGQAPEGGKDKGHEQETTEAKGQESKAADSGTSAENPSSASSAGDGTAVDIRMRYQSSDPRDVSSGALALGMALDGLDGNGPASSALIDFLEENGLLHEWGTGVEELAFAAAEFGYEGARPFHGATFEQLQAELAAGRPVVVALGTNGEGAPAHFVTVTGISADGETVTYNDPLVGEVAVDRATFEALWQAQGNSGVGFGAGAGAGASDADALPWLAFGAGLMAVLSSTPAVIRRKGLGGRLMGGGSANMGMRPPYSAPADKRWRPRLVNRYETRTVQIGWQDEEKTIPRMGTVKVKVGTEVEWQLVDDPPATPPPPTETPEPTPTPVPPTAHPSISPQSTPSPAEQPTPEPKPAPYPPTVHPGVEAESTPTPTEQPTPEPNRAPYPPGFVPEEPDPLTVPLTGGSISLSGKLVKWVRRFNKMRAAFPLQFVRQADGKVSVRVGPQIPSGSKIQYRSSPPYNIAGTRYNPSTLASIKASNLVRGARSNSALGLSLGIATAANLYDYGIGENKDTGIASPEFAASTMVDFALAGITGLAAAGTVAAVLTGAAAIGITAAATAPVWLTIGAVGVVGAGISYGLNRVIDVDALKQDVADGIRAWGGIADNAETIVRHAASRGRELIGEAGDALGQAASSVGSFVGGLFGGG